jgi:hypothetical protein
LFAVHQWDIYGDEAQLTKELALEFKNDHEFELWKQTIEAKTNSRYSQQHGVRRTRDTIVYLYKCITEGTPQAGGPERPLRSKASSRIGTCCLSRIEKTTYPDGSSTVVLTTVHTSHSINTFQPSLSIFPDTHSSRHILLEVRQMHTISYKSLSCLVRHHNQTSART